MSTQTIADMETEFLDAISRAWVDGEMEALDGFVTDDVVVHNIGRSEDYEDLEQFKAWIREVRAEFPDFAFETLDTVLSGDKLVQQYHASGTNEGEIVLIGHPATNEVAEWDGANVYRFEDGVVVLRHAGTAPATGDDLRHSVSYRQSTTVLFWACFAHRISAVVATDSVVLHTPSESVTLFLTEFGDISCDRAA